MNLPILGTLSALFTDAGSEFRKLLEPWALVAAAVLLGLGLGFFYLPLRPVLPLLAVWETWPAAWQLLAATVALFALAYLLNSLSGAFLSLAGGQLVRHWPLVGPLLTGRQSRRFAKLLAQARAGGDAADRAFYRLAYEFPAAGDLAVTRLGNVRAATAAYSLNQYGAHLDTLWPHLAQVLATGDDKLLEQLRAEQTATTFLAVLGVLFSVVALLGAPLAIAEAALTRAPLTLAGGPWLRVLLALALLPVAYAVYRAAAVRALGWGRLLRAAFDLHLPAVAAHLGLRPLPGDPAATRARWSAVSRWLAYGGLRLDDAQIRIPAAQADWYEKPAAPSPAALVCPPNIAATARVAERPPLAASVLPGRARLPARPYEVTIVASYVAEPGVSAPPAAPPAAGSFVLVTDTRLPFLPPAVNGLLHWPDATNSNVAALVQPSTTEPDALLWPLPDLAARGSGALVYTVAVETWLNAGPSVAISAVAPAASNRAQQLAVELTYNGAPGGTVELFAMPVARDRAGDAFEWAAVAGGLPGNPTPGQVIYDAAIRRAVWRIANATPGDYFLTITLREHGLM